MVVYPKEKKERITRYLWCLVFTGSTSKNPSGFQIATYDGQFWTDEKGLILERTVKQYAYLDKPLTL